MRESCKRRKSKIHFYEISGNMCPKNKAKLNKNVKKKPFRETLLVVPSKCPTFAEMIPEGHL